ncbi:MAG: type II secretion system protein [Fimbriimonadales bacterium]
MIRMRRFAYTILELLVAVGIIMILAAILAPVIVGAKRKAHESATLSNFRQIGIAVQLYRNSFDELLPHHLSDLYPDYVAEASLFVCPLDPKLGHYPNTGRMEGDAYIKSGVSFTWVPEWSSALQWNWWKPWPNRGPGKWFGLTPISECHWFWAEKFNEFDEDKRDNAKGRAVILTLDGEIVYMSGKSNMSEYDPR